MFREWVVKLSMFALEDTIFKRPVRPPFDPSTVTTARTLLSPHSPFNTLLSLLLSMCSDENGAPHAARYLNAQLAVLHENAQKCLEEHDQARTEENSTSLL